MGWLYPVPGGSSTRGFAPSSLVPNPDGPYYADDPLRRAHDADNGPNGNGQGPFPGSTRYDHFHPALDITAPIGTGIIAPEAGVVLDAQWGVDGSWANGGGFFFRVAVNGGCMYLGAHCSALLVDAGDRIARGQLIARVGETGVATGPHLHFWARLGPTPYYDPGAFYWNPALVLPGGPMYGDPRFAPGGDELPDTGLPATRVAEGDLGVTFRAVDYARTLKAGEPIREGLSFRSKTLRTFPTRRALAIIGRIDRTSDAIPAADKQFGDVLITRVYVGRGHVFGYVKQADLAGND